MATAAVTCHVLGGGELHVEVEPHELLTCLKHQVLEQLGCNEFQDIKIFNGENELCYDTSFAESGLTRGSILQVVVIRNVSRIKDVLRLKPTFVKHPPPLPPYLALLRPYTVSSTVARGQAYRSVNVEDYVSAANVIAEMDPDDEDTRNCIDDLEDHMTRLAYDVGADYSSRMAALAFCCTLEFCSTCGVVDRLRRALRDGLEYISCDYLRVPIKLGDEEYNFIWLNLIHALAPYEDAYSEDILCTLASAHEHAEIRAAAVRALGAGPAWAAQHIQALKDVAAADPDDVVRQAALGSLQSLEEAQARITLPPSPPRLEPPALRGPPPRAVLENGGERRAEETSRIEEVEMSPESLLHEQQELQEALLRSKADAYNSDGVVLCRLTFHTPEMMPYLLESEELAASCARVLNAECCVRPAWAHGALLLVPVTEQYIKEANIDLKAHNILMLNSDVQLVKNAVSRLAKRKRPALKPEYCPYAKLETSGARPGSSSLESESGQDVSSFLPKEVESLEKAAHASCNSQGRPTLEWKQDVDLVVVRTFLNFQLEKDVSNASTIIHSAPAHCDASPEQVNPHQWRLPRSRDER
eukprot:TRINITY_DN4062_c0_g4_i1.p1 TRINITY_DN4062_c0_g4~~TRINITY_DN4062_c0_g4_i1.p1  ORF type:complete len:586 (-),score=77.66 TRINITY_DN4062_c0_g4_i1:234-1991(-)